MKECEFKAMKKKKTRQGSHFKEQEQGRKLITYKRIVNEMFNTHSSYFGFFLPVLIPLIFIDTKKVNFNIIITLKYPS